MVSGVKQADPFDWMLTLKKKKKNLGVSYAHGMSRRDQGLGTIGWCMIVSIRQGRYAGKDV